MSINLSQFENTGVTKVIKFINGKIEVEEKQNVLNGEMKFFDIQEKIADVNNVIQGLNGSESEAEVTYRLIPVITDINDDIDFDRFMKMMEKPTTEFSFLLKALTDYINDLFDRADNLNNTKDAVEKLNNRIPVVKESPEEELRKIEKELPTINDKEIRKKLFRRMVELHNELGE